MSTIYLIGFMGSGKSTIGKALSRAMNGSYVDTDAYIEEKHQQHIKDMFAELGEDVFRTYESEALKELTSFDIVSTGGGIVEREENITVMRENGKIVYLQADFTDIIERLQHDDTRPLWNPDEIDSMKALFERRQAMYKEAADITIHTSGKAILDIVEEIRQLT